MRETFETVATPDGAMPTFVFHPETVDRAWPTIIWLMDGLSIRQATRDMASRLASAGYCVLLPYLFYRSGPYREFSLEPEDVKVRRRYIDALSTELVLSDISAVLAYAKELPASSDGPVGVVGYCMGGAWAITAARVFAPRIGAAASIHGGWLVTDAADSPHRNLEGIPAKIYIAWADEDATAPVSGVPIMRQALADAKLDADVDLMVGALHGFAAPGSEKYDRYASERHWERLHELFGVLRP